MSDVQASFRAAAVTLLETYATAASVKLQVYRARPASIYPPTAFVDAMGEAIVFTGPTLRQRTPTVEVVVVHGLFDSGDTVDQRDAFVDGFTDYMAGQYHAAGANTLIGAVGFTDDPAYVPDWLPLEKQRTYYATRLTLEGFATE